MRFYVNRWNNEKFLIEALLKIYHLLRFARRNDSRSIVATI